MRKLICLLILPLLAVFCFVGCSDDKTFNDVKTLYEKMISENKEIFFIDEENPNTITIKYSEEINNLIKTNEPPVVKSFQRYVAIAQQQDILEVIFNYYEKNNENFYTNISSKDVSMSESNELYNRLQDLYSSLADFKDNHTRFLESTDTNASEVMTFSMINYAYELNLIIDKSFNFMNKFIQLNTKYCVKDYDINSIENIQLRIDKAYVDMAYIDFLESYKGFEFSVAEDKGVCDLSDMIADLYNVKAEESERESYDYENGYINIREIHQEILDGLHSDDANYERVQNKFNQLVYNQQLFEQRVDTYLENYKALNMYEINQYRYGVKQDVTYGRYKDSLPEETRIKLKSNEEFILEICNKNYIASLIEILG